MPKPVSRPARMTSVIAVTALAATFVAAPSFVQFSPMADAAYAKGGNGNGNGNGGGKGNGGKSSSGGGKGSDKSSSAKTRTKGGGGNSALKRGASSIDRALGNLFGADKRKAPKRSGGSKKAVAAAPAVVEPEVDVVVEEQPPEPLRPDQKGKWNAANANQRALDVHIKNEKWNGTIGALSMYQLAGKAASGAELTDDEQNALNNLLAGYDAQVSDDQLTELLNSDDPEAPVWTVEDGVATCEDNCAEADEDAANQQISDYIGDQDKQQLLVDAEQRIIDDSNKSTDGIESQLLDELATQLGFERVDPAADDIVIEDDPDLVVVDDEDIVPIDG